MPTTRPRYTIADTGEVSEMLDLAGRAWPEVTERKELLLRLTSEGHDAVKRRLADSAGVRRQAAQLKALGRGAALVDVDLLLGDAAWR